MQPSKYRLCIFLLSPYINKLSMRAIFCWQPPLNSLFLLREIDQNETHCSSHSEPLVYQNTLKLYCHFLLLLLHTNNAGLWPLLCIQLKFSSRFLSASQRILKVELSRKSEGSWCPSLIWNSNFRWISSWSSLGSFETLSQFLFLKRCLMQVCKLTGCWGFPVYSYTLLSELFFWSTLSLCFFTLKLTVKYFVRRPNKLCQHVFLLHAI